MAGNSRDVQIDFPTVGNGTPALNPMTAATTSTATAARPQHPQFNYHAIAANVNAFTTGVPNMNTFTNAPNLHAHNGSISRVSHLPRRSPSTSQSSKGRKPSSLGGSLESGSSQSNNIHPTPLFQRLVTEEVQELKAYARIIEQQNRRSAELERAHGDLEARLEIQSERRLELERSLEERERTWAQQISSLERDRDHWKDIVQMERNKNNRLMDQVAKKDQEIHRMLQRKYDLRGGPDSRGFNGGPNGGLSNTAFSLTNPRRTALQTIGGSPVSPLEHKSPNEWLMAAETAEFTRRVDVMEALDSFFGGML